MHIVNRVYHLGMMDILGSMSPGEVYSFEDICTSLENHGYRVTNTDTVKVALSKLCHRGEIIAVSGFYIKTEDK